MQAKIIRIKPILEDNQRKSSWKLKFFYYSNLKLTLNFSSWEEINDYHTWWESLKLKMNCRKLGYEIISIWNLKRKLAEEMGLSISEFNLLGEKPENQHEFDLKYEEYQKNLDLNSQVILESRLWFLCQPNAFKVFLNVSDEVASQRILNDKRTTDHFFSPEEALQVTKKRNQDDQNRYLSLYNIDLWDSSQYNLTIDTSNLTPEEVVEKILIEFSSYLEKNSN